MRDLLGRAHYIVQLSMWPLQCMSNVATLNARNGANSTARHEPLERWVRRHSRFAACTTSLTSLMRRLICWLVRSSSFSCRWRLSRKCGLSARHSVNSRGCRPTPMAAEGCPQLGATPPSSATFTERPHPGPSRALNYHN